MAGANEHKIGYDVEDFEAFMGLDKPRVEVVSLKEFADSWIARDVVITEREAQRRDTLHLPHSATDAQCEAAEERRDTLQLPHSATDAQCEAVEWHRHTLVQFADSVLTIEGHPDSRYCGVYRVTSEHNGLPVLKNAGGMFCYYYSPRNMWFLSDQFVLDSALCNAYINAGAGATLPTGTKTWQCVSGGGGFRDCTMTATNTAVSAIVQ